MERDSGSRRRIRQPLAGRDLRKGRKPDLEFEQVRHSPTRLRRFHDKLATLNFLDPACGGGNFLVVTYRELRRPEHKVVAEIERPAQAVLDARDQFPDSSLADLYDPLTMPPDLAEAHQALDRAVDRLYRIQPFDSDKDRLELLFTRNQELTSVLKET